jgi:hypothetical protein
MAKGTFLFPAFMATLVLLLVRPAAAQNPCQPCLFYTGDYDPSNANASALSNENDLIDTGGSGTYQGFVVPEGQVWTVSGLLVNVLANTSVIDPVATGWEIRKNPAVGNGGVQIFHGSANATFTPTGRSGQGLTEYTLLVPIETVKLTSGNYIFGTGPQCTNTADSACAAARYFSSDQTHQPGLNALGPAQPWDDALFNSALFNAEWIPTYGPTGACGGTGCDQFSVGLLGTSSTSAAATH